MVQTGLIFDVMNTKIITLLFSLLVLTGCGSLIPTYKAPEDEINIGYGTTTRERKTNAVSSIQVDERDAATYTNIYQYIADHASGVEYTGGMLIVRSSVSFKGSQPPLLVLDGVPVDDISSLTPQMIKSIDVLKDGSAAIYGSRGADGVILITTK